MPLYMLDLQPRDVLWRLAVKNASNALMICRLQANFTVHNIIDFLLTNGIPFHTLQPSQTVLRTPNIPRPSLLPLVRPDKFIFGNRDYLSYREHCHAILNHPRGRAALMHGGFMWRISFRSVLWEAVFGGPSGWSTDIDEMIVVRDSTNTEYIDDKLSTAEKDALCGTYHYLTGKSLYSTYRLRPNLMLGDQRRFAIKSWYMPPNIFEKSMLNLGRWSSHTESLFNLLDRTFIDQHHNTTLSRQPLSRAQWNDRARSSLAIKKARQRVELEAAKILA